MTDLRKAAEMAMKWMEATHHTAMTTYSDEAYEEHCKVERELRQALAQPEPVVEPTNSATNLVESKHLAQTVQAPIAYLCENATGHKYFRWKKPTSHYKPIALYTAPLKPEQTKCLRCGEVNPAEIHTCSPQVAQEPVAWITPDGEGFRMRLEPPVNDVPLGWKALYTAPPKPWVGLHLDDIPETFVGDWSFLEGARWAEAKLKEKNI